MAELSDEELGNIAYDFYTNKLNIEDISQKYELSRYKVTKAIEQAQAKHIVTIKVRRGVKRNIALEEQFKSMFGLKEAFILRKLETKTEDETVMVSFAAQVLQNYILARHNIGLTWGTSSLDIVKNFQAEEAHQLTFVQLLGVPLETKHRKDPLAETVAKKFDSNYRILPVPLYVVNPKVKLLLEQEPFYQFLTSYYHKLDLLFTGIGTMQSVEEDEFTREKYEQTVFKGLNREQVAGLIFGRPYDIKGRIYNQVDQYILGIEQAELRKVPVRFVIEKNRFKARALLGALRTGYITHLVTNEGIALRIMQQIQAEAD